MTTTSGGTRARDHSPADPPAAQGSGPLSGITVVEMAGKGPAPLCGMLLADLGADVVRVERPDNGQSSAAERGFDILHRNRRSLGLDLKRPEAREIALRLVARADVLIEGFRPGVMERLGLGPQPCLEVRPSLVYGRVTGWGQHGPLAQRAGHDINYLAVSGALHAIGARHGPPVAPLNLLADYGAGAMFLAFGVVCGVLEARSSSRGQVIDAAMCDGVASLLTAIHGLRHAGHWSEERGTNLLDGGAPFYRAYETADGRHMAVGAIEPQFHAEAASGLDMPQPATNRMDPAAWPHEAERMQRAFASRTQAQWRARFDDADACVSPVLPLREAPSHPHHRARRTYVEFHGQEQPAPAPRFSRTPGRLHTPPSEPGAHTRALLQWLGESEEAIDALLARGTVFEPSASRDAQVPGP